MTSETRISLYLAEVETRDLRAELNRRNDLYRAGRCYRCVRSIGDCTCPVGRVSVPPVTAREPRIFNGVNPDIPSPQPDGSYFYTPDPETHTFPTPAEACCDVARSAAEIDDRSC